MIAVIALTSQSVGAFGGTYPDSGGFLDFNEGTLSVDKGCYTPTDAKHLFAVDGKQFILLDRDSEGNYFVMTQEHYGQYPFETAVAGHQVVQEAVETSGQVTFSRGNKPDNAQWVFNPENNASIAYWLNHAFYDNGNGGNVLPESVKNHMLEREWQVEGFKTYNASGTRLFDKYYDSIGVSGYTPSEVIASELVQKPYRVKCKLALMSLSEYLRYQRVIGVSFAFSNWGGMMLRSQDAFLTTGSESRHNQLKYYFGPLQVFAPSQNSSDKLRVNIADAADGTYYYVRPVFWLSKDFFANVKCSVDSLGAYPKQFVLDNSYSGLKKLYTDTEIAALGVIKPEGETGGILPSAEHVCFTGDASDGKTLSGTYEYHKNSDSDSPGLGERFTVYQWYVSDTVDGKKNPLFYGDNLSITLDNSTIGKYIWLAVTPKNAFNNKGETVFSDKIVRVRENREITVAFSDAAGSSVSVVPDDGRVNIDISYRFSPNKTATAYIAEYDAERKLIHLKTYQFRGEGKEVTSMEIPKGASCKVIILGEPDGTPYGIYEIKH